MKQYILIAIAMVVTIATYAQRGPKDPYRAAAKQTEKMKSHLALSETQYASVKKINSAYAEKIMEIKKESGNQDGEQNKELKELRQQKQKDINAVLTPEQQQKWTDFKK